MSKLVELKSWKCTDGKLFDCREEAEKHQNFIEVLAFVRSHVDSAPDDYSEAMAQFIIDNAYELADLLGWRDY